MTDAPARERPRHWIEVVATILLSVATVATAWAGYQSSRWHGEQAKAQSTATAKRLEATRLSGVANRKVQIDVAVFTEWVGARGRDETELATFYRRRFTDRFEPAFAVWISMRPFTNPDAAKTPFDLPEYRVAELTRSERLEVQADAAGAEARKHIQRADNYVLCVVLFATSLFFAGLSTRMTTWKGRAVILGQGCVIFVATLIWMATFPLTVAI